MKLKIQVVIESDEENNQPIIMEEVACFERAEKLSLETLGLTLVEGKQLLAAVQKKLTEAQLKQYLAQERKCSHCAKPLIGKARHALTFRTLFGKLSLDSPRYYSCKCQPSDHQSFSPLATLLAERTAPEFSYLQTKWAALLSYGMTASLLQEILPLDKPVSTAALSERVKQAAERLEGELGEERVMFIEGCQLEWEALPPPDAPLTIGIDGGYVRGREGNNRKAGNFEVIVGKSMPHEGPNKRFGFVNGYDTKPKRRLFELLKSQGMQFNQPITFLSDGGDTVRDLQLYLNPEAEHLLDWFHITMRLTVLSQLTKGLPTAKPKPKKNPNKHLADELDELEWPKSEEILKKLERVKWYIWHGNVYQALSNLEDLEMELSPLEEHYAEIQKLFLKLEEFIGYIRSNQKFIVNYGDRYRNQETISSAFVESTVNEVISKRFVKKQQMRWTKAGVHRLLQVRTKVLDEEWRATYSRWYPEMKIAEEPVEVERSKVA